MPQITRKIEFDAGHRVLGHEGKCRNLHGHRYVVEVTVEAERLDSLGRVIDFSVVKDIVGGWIDEKLDHNMILHPDDPLLRVVAIEDPEKDEELPTNAQAMIGRRPFVMPRYLGNPTAENLAELIGLKAQSLLHPLELAVVSIRIYETPNCSSTWSPRKCN